MDVNAVIDEIFSGRLDDGLDQIKDAVKARREQSAQRLAFQLRPGDEVKVVGDLRPRYLIGLVGVVKRVNPKTVTLDFEGENKLKAGRYARGVRMPLTYVEKNVPAEGLRAVK